MRLVRDTVRKRSKYRCTHWQLSPVVVPVGFQDATIDLGVLLQASSVRKQPLNGRYVPHLAVPNVAGQNTLSLSMELYAYVIISTVILESQW